MAKPEDGSEGKRFAFTANHATVMVAIIGATTAFLGTLYTSHESLLVSQEDLQAKLIFRAVDGSNLRERAKNLHFLIDAGLLQDPDGKISSLKDERFPSKGDASFDCSADQGDAAQMICRNSELAAMDKIMADQYVILLGLKDKEANAILRQQQRHWLAERNSCTEFGPTAESCMAEKYKRRIAYLFSRANDKPAAAVSVVAGAR